MDIGHLRNEYASAELDLGHLDSDPWKQFELWFEQACAVQIPEPNAMSLSTVNAQGQPSLRTVLLKYFDSDGFVFFTNYQGKKARQIGENPHVALLFFWAELHRQIKVEGKAEKVPAATSLKYFASRPRGSQLGAWCSPQSTVITSRAILLAKLEEVKRKFANREVPLPSFWGGFRVVPSSIEFWQGRPDRLHDRFLYRRQGPKDWVIQRLAP